MNRIIAIEGGDACGKATHSKLLAEALRGTRFPFPEYATPTGQAILGHLKGAWCAARNANAGLDVLERLSFEPEINPLVFQCLQTANRLEMLPAIQLALNEGPIVFDRWCASAIVYGTLDGLDPAWVRSIQIPMLEPDAWILLDVPVEEGFRRRPERRDRYEVDHGYLEKVRVSYLRLFQERDEAARNTRISRVGGEPRWHVVDGLGSIEEVHTRIVELLR